MAISIEDIEKIINDDWVLMDDCEGNENGIIVKYLARIALASLTAKAIGSFHISEQSVEATSDYVKDGEWPIDEGEIVVYTAPPVPVIKLPDELTDLVNAVDFYNAVKAENPKVETGTWKDADEWIKRAAVTAAPLVKRLNGLEE